MGRGKGGGARQVAVRASGGPCHGGGNCWLQWVMIPSRCCCCCCYCSNSSSSKAMWACVLLPVQHTQRCAALQAACCIYTLCVRTWRARAAGMGGTRSCSRLNLRHICSGIKSARAPINCPACRQQRGVVWVWVSYASSGTNLVASRLKPRHCARCQWLRRAGHSQSHRLSELGLTLR